MKSRNTLIRSKKFQLDEKRRKVAQMEAMIADFQRMAADLEREIVAEQERAGIHDPSHFAYPTYAKAAMARRENLKRSIDELAAQLSGAKIALQESAEELKRVELLDERDQSRDRAAEEGREQVKLDALAALRAIAEKQESSGDESDGGIPAREMLGDMLLEMKRPEQALAEYKTGLKFFPNRFNSLYGAAQAAEMAGQASEATEYYAVLVKTCEGSSSERPELAKAKQAVVALK